MAPTAARKARSAGPAVEVSLDLDAVQAEGAGDPYTVRLGGQVYELPSLEDLDWALIEAADTGDTKAIRVCIKAALGDDADAFLENRLTIRGLTQFFTGWLQHSGLAPGESDGSSTS